MNAVQPSLARKIAAIPVALLVPPLGVFLARGADRHFYACLAVFALSLLVFFTLFAGVGMLLYVLASFYGLLLALWMTFRRP
jgi:uncharacterized membrane protein YqaE (UPF0057 family)